MKSLSVTFLVFIIFLSACKNEYKISEPYKSEKIAVVKAINTTGETELIRKVKLEKFELINVLLTKDMLDTIDSQIEWKRQSMIEWAKERIEFNKERRDYYYRNAKTPILNNMKDTYLYYAKDYDKKVKEYEAEIIRYENKTDDNTLIKYYENVKKIHLEYGDTTAKVFNVIYLIDNAKTNTKFSFLGKDDSTAIKIEITKELLMKQIIDTWSN